MSITVYSKPDCVQCAATYRELNKSGIDYDIVDVSEDTDAYNHVVALGYKQIPVVETSEDHWSGYRPDKIAKLAGASCD